MYFAVTAEPYRVACNEKFTRPPTQTFLLRPLRRERQTKDSRLGALCLPELIRKRDFENSNDIMFASPAAGKRRERVRGEPEDTEVV